MEGFGKAVEDAIFHPAGADGVDRDATAGQRYGEIAHQDFQGCFRGTHGDPGLPASEASAGRETDGDDPSAIGHQGSCFTHTDQKGLGLGIHCGVPLFQCDVHWGFVESRSFRAGIADENIERAEFGADLLEEAEHFFGPANVGLHEKSVGAEGADFFEGGLRGILVLVIVNSDLRAACCELQGDASADAAGASSDEDFLSLE